MKYLANEIVFFYLDENKIKIDCGILNKNRNRVKFFDGHGWTDAYSAKVESTADKKININPGHGKDIEFKYYPIGLAMSKLVDNGWVDLHKNNKFSQLIRKYKYNFDINYVIPDELLNDCDFCNLALVNYSDIEPIKKEITEILQEQKDDDLKYLNDKNEIKSLQDGREF